MTRRELLKGIISKKRKEVAKLFDECVTILDKYKCCYDKDAFIWANPLGSRVLYAHLRQNTESEVYYAIYIERDHFFFTINHMVNGRYERLAEMNIPRE